MGRLTRMFGKLAGSEAKSGAGAGAVPAEGAAAGDGLDALMRDGVARHMKGDLDGAESAYREVLREDAEHVDALHLLGAALGQRGDLDPAITFLTRAIELDRDHVAARVDLGNVHRAAGDTERAAGCYSTALELSPDNVAAHRNLGYLLLEQGDHSASVGHLEAAIAAEPDVLRDRLTLGVVLAQSGAHREAIEHLGKAIELDPNLAEAHRHIAHSFNVCGSYDAAERHFKRAFTLDPGDYIARNEYGLLMKRFGQLDAAIDQFRKVIESAPGYIGGYINLGNAQRQRWHFNEARRCYEKALEIDPESADAYTNLGTVLKDQGRVAEGVKCMRRAIELRPDLIQTHSSLLLALQYLDDVSVEDLYREHEAWVRVHVGSGANQFQDYRNPPDPDRPLRIGYLSPDLATHPVGLFLEPVIGAHDRSRVNVTCYSDRYPGDEVTERLSRLADGWRVVAGESDERVAELIQADGIDILVDLAGHSANNRMTLFARKPAPVQATWIGYLHSTGLPQVDYLVADSVAVPEDTLQPFSEKVIRLPQCFLCYGTPENRPQVSPSPFSANGYVTFGCFNNLAKISDSALRLWKEILERVPSSRLMVKNSAFNEKETREYYSQKLERMGLDVNRVALDRGSGHSEYFSSFSRIDVLLDPVPFSGGTITADALWMGVPVVTLAGDRMASRTSASLLTCLGLESLVTFDDATYVERAAALAAAPAALQTLRESLRQRFSGNALGDPGIFCRELEAAYRRMWQPWCRGASVPR